MARDGVIQVRVDQELKRQADELFEDLGLDTASAIRLFLKQSVIRERLPFKIKRYASGKKIKEKEETPQETIPAQITIEEPDPIINDLY